MEPTPKPRFMWRTFFGLFALGCIGIAAVIPYTLALRGDVIAASPLPLPVILLATSLQSALLLALALFAGLKLIPKTFLPTHDLTLRGSQENLRRMGLPAALWGTATGALILLFNSFFAELIPALAAAPTPVWWQGALAALYGGITEELLLRFGFMTFVVFLLLKTIDRRATRLRPRTALIAIVISALVFGLLHLPATALVVDLTPLVIFRGLLLNGVGAVVFGWLFYRHGITAAIIAHFYADLVIHVIRPLIEL